MDLEERVTIPMIAKRAGVTPQAVWNWRRRFPTFPESLDLGSPDEKRVYSWAEVETWMGNRGKPRPNRRRKIRIGVPIVSFKWKVLEIQLKTRQRRSVR